MKIVISTTIAAPIDRVWAAWTGPDDIIHWNFAAEDWCCPTAEIDLSPGGRFSYRMEARDGSTGFDFEGTFTRIVQGSEIEYALADGRRVQVRFSQAEDSGVLVEEVFEAEDTMSGEQQRQGWQAILDNFRKHVEASPIR